MIIKNKNKYHSSAKLAEDAKIDCEVGKNNPNLTQSHKTKLASKIESTLKIAKEAEKEYIDSLTRSNILRTIYIEETKKSLDEFEKIEKNCIDFIKELLLKNQELTSNLYENLINKIGSSKKVK
jgi:hypothetical protein